MIFRKFATNVNPASCLLLSLSTHDEFRVITNGKTQDLYKVKVYKIVMTCRMLNYIK